MGVAVAVRLAELEQVIEGGIATFRAVGEALAAVRDEQLYLESHRTFADYCRDRWGLSPASAYRRIGQAEDARDLPEGAEARSQRQIARDKQASRARDTAVIDVSSSLRMVEDDGPDAGTVPPGDLAGERTTLPAGPGRPDTPRLNAILDAMGWLEPDTAGVLADRDQYERLLRWARAFKDAYEVAHPPTKPAVQSNGKAEVVPRFKQKHAAAR